MRYSFFGIPINDEAHLMGTSPGREVEVAQMGYWIKGVVASKPPWGRIASLDKWVMVRQPYHESSIEVESLREHIFPAGTLEALYGKPADNANALEYVNGQLDLNA